MRTIDVDDEIYVQAERKAHAQDKSVSEVVADYLRQWIRQDEIAAAQAAMRKRFANPDWQFAVGELESREQRNARR